MKLVFSILLATFVLFQGAAYAKTVSGQVVSTDTTANSLTVSHANAETGTDENVVLWVKDTTTFSGAASLAELKTGDAVSVDAEEDAATQNWIATSVTLSQPSAPAATPAQ